MSHGEGAGGGLKSAEKVSRIIRMAPKGMNFHSLADGVPPNDQ